MGELNPDKLQRSLNLPLALFYGLGTILGAGIYVLVGQVSIPAGASSPVSFLIASLLAAFSAFSYAELSARFPRSGGESIYMEKAFKRRPLSVATGILIVLSGTVSPAVLLNGFSGYLKVFVDWPDWAVVSLLALALTGVAAYGMKESALVITLITLVEIGGLVLVLATGYEAFGKLGERLPEILPDWKLASFSGIFAGSLLAFYAFIGFEDMANVAEEVKNPERNLPLAILIALAVSTTLYVAVSLLAVLSLDLEELTASRSPLASIYEKNTGSKPWLIGIIGLFSTVNGILVQMIMASRALYGMSREKWIPPVFDKIHPFTKTPIAATVVVGLIALALALTAPIAVLAQASSFVVLIIFTSVNLALWKIKRSASRAEGVWKIPAWVPIAGFFANVAFIGFQIYRLVFQKDLG